jgi:hypothetical protein
MSYFRYRFQPLEDAPELFPGNEIGRDAELIIKALENGLG